jgi:hypothetical protein
MPAWLTTPPSTAVNDSAPRYLRDLSTYLSDLTSVIYARITSLTDVATTTRPPWLDALGTPPAGPAASQWRSHTAVVAAWRDQHAITTDNAGDVLGPRPEPGSDHEPAWQHAGAALAEARRLSARPGRDGPDSGWGDTSHAEWQRDRREARHAARQESAIARRGQQRNQDHEQAQALTPPAMHQEDVPLLPPPPGQQAQQERPINW